MDTRWGKVKWGPQGDRVRTSEAYWKRPFRWNEEAAETGQRRRVFCASLADVFDPHQQRTDPGLEDTGHHNDLEMWRSELWFVIEETPHLDWMLLTKHPQNVRDMIPEAWRYNGLPRNVWLGTSVEDQHSADMRIVELVKLPAHVLFLSCEPLLGSIDLRRWLLPTRVHESHGILALEPRVDWAIIGGESGPKARPMRMLWVKFIMMQCAKADIPVFVKQLGACPIDEDGGAMNLEDKKGGDIDEWPEDLQVRQWPESAMEAGDG